MDEKNPAADETEVRNLDKYFPVVRILTAGSRSLIGAGRQILKVRNCSNIAKAFTLCSCLESRLLTGVWVWEKAANEHFPLIKFLGFRVLSLDEPDSLPISHRRGVGVSGSREFKHGWVAASAPPMITLPPPSPGLHLSLSLSKTSHTENQLN